MMNAGLLFRRFSFSFFSCLTPRLGGGGGGGGWSRGGTPKNGPYGKAPPELKGYLFQAGVYYIKGWGFHELKYRKEL